MSIQPFGSSLPCHSGLEDNIESFATSNKKQTKKAPHAMDLLAGYDSDSSDAASANDDKRVARAAAATTVAPATTTNKVDTTASASDSPVASAAQGQERRRGKKLLKLQAVLPQHIWNQLTKTAAATIDDDSDVDEDADERPLKPVIRKAATQSGSSSGASGSDLLNLLHALPTGISNQNNTLRILGVTNKDPAPEESPTASATVSVPISSGLGMAFLSSTVQVTRNPRGKATHSETKESWTTIHVETVQDHDEKDKPNKKKAVVDTTPRPLSSSSSSSSAYSIPRPTQQQQPTTRRTVTAAPTVRAAPPSTYTTPTTIGYQTPVNEAASYAYEAASASTHTLSKKQRKRQMEAMLRAGNLDAVAGDLELTSGGNMNYALQALEQQQHASAAASASYQAHGVRVVPTTSYNTSTGQVAVSTAISGKQRGKNQLNALLANAASLEAKRLQTPLPHASSTTQPNANPYRNNAKRKYGW